jgi:hypothetical protein
MVGSQVASCYTLTGFLIMRLRAQPFSFWFIPPLVLVISALCGLLRERPPDAVLIAVMLGWSAVMFWTLARALDENKALVFLCCLC